MKNIFKENVDFDISQDNYSLIKIRYNSIFKELNKIANNKMSLKNNILNNDITDIIQIMKENNIDAKNVVKTIEKETIKTIENQKQLDIIKDFSLENTLLNVIFFEPYEYPINKNTKYQPGVFSINIDGYKYACSNKIFFYDIKNNDINKIPNKNSLFYYIEEKTSQNITQKEIHMFYIKNINNVDLKKNIKNTYNISSRKILNIKNYDIKKELNVVHFLINNSNKIKHFINFLIYLLENEENIISENVINSEKHLKEMVIRFYNIVRYYNQDVNKINNLNSNIKIFFTILTNIYEDELSQNINTKIIINNMKKYLTDFYKLISMCLIYNRIKKNPDKNLLINKILHNKDILPLFNDIYIEKIYEKKYFINDINIDKHFNELFNLYKKQNNRLKKYINHLLKTDDINEIKNNINIFVL